MNTLELSVDADGIALIRIDLPGRTMNVLTPEFQDELAQAIDGIASDDAIRGAILTSGKAGSFIAGADIQILVQAFGRGISAEDGAATSQALSKLLRRLETCGKPIACAMNGLALGGGFEVALACHYRVLADSAQVGLPEVGLGLLPGGGGTQRLPRLIGIEKAAPILLRGMPVKAAEALKLGLVHSVAKAEEVISVARAWLLNAPKPVQPWDEKGFRVPGGVGPSAPHAQLTFTAGTAVAAQTTQRNLPAPLAILSCIYEGTIVPIDVGLRIESKYFGKLLSGPVARNMSTMFVNKNAADKLARRPPDVPKSKVARLGVLGAGMMGSGIAYSASAAGIEVVLLDSTQEQADKGKSYSARLLQKRLERSRTTQEKMDAQLARIHPTTRYEELAGCDLVIEAVFESRTVKAEVTQKADAILSKSAVFASNTSTLPITGLATTFSRPEQFIGLHFFSPVDRMPLVEVIVGKQTSQETLARALDFVGQIRKTPIVVNDSPGFYTSRVFATYFQEGVLMLEEGVKPALIENAARQAGFSVGPLQVADEVTLELQLNVIEQNLADGHPAAPQLPRVLGVLRKMVRELKRTGRRNGAGYYDYGVDGERTLWVGLSDLYPPTERQPHVDEVKNRLLFVQALETLRCIEEDVVTHASDADLGAILGIGFPTWTGGPVSFVETIGLPHFVRECTRMAELHGPRFFPSASLRERVESNTAI